MKRQNARFNESNYLRDNGTNLPFDGTDRVFSSSENGIWKMALYNTEWVPVGYPNISGSTAWTEISIQDDLYGHQVIWGYNTADMYSRRVYDGIWYPWEKIGGDALLYFGHTTDANIATSRGQYGTNSSTTNLPTAATGTLLVQAYGDVVTQFYIPFNHQTSSQGVWIRSSNGSPPHWNPWVNIGGGVKHEAMLIYDGNAHTIIASKNVASVSNGGEGHYTVNFATPFPNANYVVTGLSGGDGDHDDNNFLNMKQLSSRTAASCLINNREVPNDDTEGRDSNHVHAMFTQII